MSPVISIIMPVYNQREKYLRASIDSILYQSYKNFEFLIIDDGSSDLACKNLLKQYASRDQRIRLIHNSYNIGLTRSLNKGLLLAKGKFIARMDSDDIAEPHRLEKQLDFIQHHSLIELCGSWVRLIDETGSVLATMHPPTDHESIRKIILKGNVFNHCTWFFRKSLISKAGYYSESAIKTEDYEFLLRIIPHYQVAIIPEYLCQYRINNAGISFTNNKVQEWHAIKVRWKALRHYGYKKIEYIYLFRSLFIFFFVPFFIKKKLYRYLIWQHEKKN